jgi:YegS/Rv2252/BmrU family lipid kinase
MRPIIDQSTLGWTQDMHQLRPIGALDRRLFRLLTRRQRRSLDRTLTRLTRSANRSMLWLVIAEILAATGGRAGRRAAVRGVTAIALASALVNGPLKMLARRDRPVSRAEDRPPPFPLPGSSSFPSGHAASAFAFAIGASIEEARVLPLLLPAAAGVAYSRVRLRLHYPFDVLAGAAIGTGAGVLSGPLIRGVRGFRDSRQPAPPDRRPHSRQVILVASPHAGGGATRLDRARRAIQAAGLQIVEQIPVQDLERLPELLQRDSADRPIVVSAGGDGTVGAVANYLVGTDVVLGILPLGTSNDFARSLEIPMRVEEAARLLTIGKVSTIDVGRMMRPGAQPAYFVHAATVGVNVSFARFATRTDLRRRFGRLTYAVAAARALREHKVFGCTLDLDGQQDRLELTNLSVVNAPVFGGALGLQLPGASPEDRTLDVLLVEHLPLRRLVRSAILALIGVHRPIRGIRTLQVKRMNVEPDQPLEVALDGELRGTIPGTFDVVAEALRVITPASFEDADGH